LGHTRLTFQDNGPGVFQLACEPLVVRGGDLELAQGNCRHLAIVLEPALSGRSGACRANGKCLGIGGILFDHELRTEIVRLGARYLTARNDVQHSLRGARADIERMKTLPVPRQ
jgi:hypothetical protein